jgi:hypothetical protein
MIHKNKMQGQESEDVKSQTQHSVSLGGDDVTVTTFLPN